MKRFFAVFTVVLVLVLSIAPTAYAEQFEGFSIDFPANFAGAYTSVESDTESDFFTEDLLYETKSDYELMRVLIGQSNNLNNLFAEDFGFANRQDLDLSLLTEQQLADEAEKLTAYIDMSFPFYMTYVTPKSMTVDDRLGLVVTGYYTDFSGGLTGEFRAYEFYYMGQLVILYYDTQIDGTYFVESVFELPDSIVGTLDFELNPSVKPTNVAWYSEALSAAAPVVGLLVGAVLLGILFGLAFKKRPNKSTEDFMMDTSPSPARPVENAPNKPDVKAEAPKPAPLKVQKPEQPKADSPSETSQVIEEEVDWNSMLNDLRQSTVSAKTPVEEEKKPDPPVQTEPTPSPETVSKPIQKSDVETQKKTIETPEIEVSQPVISPSTAMALDANEDPLFAQLKAFDDMSDEIAKALGALQASPAPTQAITSAPAKAVATPLPVKEKSATEPVVAVATAKDILSDFGSKANTSPVPKEDKLPNLSENKSAQAVTDNYQSYLDNLLPSRKKFQKKPETDGEAPLNNKKQDLNESNNDEPDDVVFDLDKQNKIVDDDFNMDKTSGLDKKEKRPGIFSRMLTSVAEKIERDEDADPEPEFDSRMEMHISEKTERNSVEKLMPGLFDDEPEAESVEILLDQGEDLKFERAKKKAPKTQEERTKQIKNRVDNLFDE